MNEEEKFYDKILKDDSLIELIDISISNMIDNLIIKYYYHSYQDLNIDHDYIKNELLKKIIK